MSIRNWVRKKRRDYWRDRVMDLGPLINEAYRERTALIEARNTADTPALENVSRHIAFLESRRLTYLDKLRSTA